MGIGERVGRETTGGALGELASPEGLDRISTVVDATVTRSLEAALRAPAAVHGRRGGGPGLSLVDRLSRDSAAAIGAALSAELQAARSAPTGTARLRRAWGRRSGGISGSAVRGAGGELDELFPGCERAEIDAAASSSG